MNRGNDNRKGRRPDYDRKGRRKLLYSLHLPQEAEESTIQEVRAIRLSNLQQTSQ